ncbi:E3 ubiquitin-protein ligase sina-like [Armigeres subalbatus]|uniref:E3 ubiquitin-protein ligase sina-like n=1 Tax=Armigeres subalbatus TaxID=124917 RepID=UPI002ED60240
MESTKLKCILCKKYPNEEVYECNNRHVGCISCVNNKDTRLCPCTQTFTRKKQNPIEKLEKQTKIPCEFKESGCTWLFGVSQLDSHQQECKFRPYRCIIASLNVKPCEWTGPQHEIEEHLEDDHLELGTSFSYFQESAQVPFRAKESNTVVKLVDAFSKNFMFYYRSNIDSRMVYFMIVYFGRRVEAHQYFYEFDIRSTAKHGVPRAKFTQQCVADCEDFEQLMEQEKDCIAISFKTIQHYLRDGNSIEFRFIVKKVEKDVDKGSGRERKISEKGKKESPGMEEKSRTRYISGSSVEDPPLNKQIPKYEYPIF